MPEAMLSPTPILAFKSKRSWAQAAHLRLSDHVSSARGFPPDF
jgi:hypothetical protein